jgi:putative DNA primase/helicase
MVKVATIAAEHGQNVYIEARTVRRELRGNIRGEIKDTQYVFGLVIDNDFDTDKATELAVEATITVETSPGNSHQWLFFDRLVDAKTAYDLGRRVRAATKACGATGDITHVYRVAGTPNYPGPSKVKRGRTVCPTHLMANTGRLWSPGEIASVFPEITFAKPSSDDDIPDIEIKMIASALDAIPNWPPFELHYDDWFKVNCALHWAATQAPEHATQLQELADKWSRQANGKYNNRTQQKTWKSIKDSRDKKLITIDSLYRVAEGCGWKRWKIEYEINAAKTKQRREEIEREQAMPWDKWCALYGIDPVHPDPCAKETTILGCYFGYPPQCPQLDELLEQIRSGEAFAAEQKVGADIPPMQLANDDVPPGVDQQGQIKPAVQKSNPFALDWGNKAKGNRQDTNGQQKKNKSFEIINLKDVKPEPIHWLWPDWIAEGKFHIIAGMYGDGKSQIALEFAATLSRGGNWPDGQKAPVKDVVIWSGEDKLEDVIVPRLLRMGADMVRIHVIKSVSEDGAKREFNPATDMDILEAAIEKINGEGGDVGLVITDPVVSVASGKGDSHKNVDMRAALQPIVSLGERRNCAILGITHFTKGTSGRDPRERVTGSLAFGAVARLIMVTGARLNPKEGEAPRIFIRAKSNNGPDKGGFGYDFDVGPLRENTEIITSRVKWLDPLEGTARELLDDAEKGPNKDDERKRKAREIRDWLEGFLRDGPKVSNEVFAKGNKLGYSNDQIVRARKALGLISTKGEFQGPSIWSLQPF